MLDMPELKQLLLDYISNGSTSRTYKGVDSIVEYDDYYIVSASFTEHFSIGDFDTTGSFFVPKSAIL